VAFLRWRVDHSGVLRALVAAKIQMPYRQICTEANQIAKVSKTTFDFKGINVNIPAPTEPQIRALIDESAKELVLKHQANAEQCWSRRAGHGPPRARRHDLHPQRRRHQPLT